MKDNNHKAFIFAFFMLLLSTPFFGENSLAEGESYFRENHPLEACMFFEKALEEDSENPSIYNLLGLSYFQLGDFEKAIATFTKGCALQSKLNYILYYNAGNSAFAMGEYELALDYYSKSIEDNENFASSFLNRANTKVKLNRMMESIEDYKKYLALEDDSAQRDKIENLIYEINRAWFEQEKGRITYETQEEMLNLEIQRLLIEKENRKLEQELRLRQADLKKQELLGRISSLPPVESEPAFPEGAVSANDIAPFPSKTDNDEEIFVENASVVADGVSVVADGGSVVVDGVSTEDDIADIAVEAIDVAENDDVIEYAETDKTETGKAESSESQFSAESIENDDAQDDAQDDEKIPEPQNVKTESDFEIEVDNRFYEDYDDEKISF